jgi:probable HAF family extracellular repeat protein
LFFRALRFFVVDYRRRKIMTTQQQQTLDIETRPSAMISTRGHAPLLARQVNYVGHKLWTQIIARRVSPMLFTILIGACCVAALSAQERANRQFQVINLPSLGGARSIGNSLNNRGWAAGYSNLPGNQSRHAVLWRHGLALDIGTLGGPNSNVAWPVKNNRGIIVGIAQTATPEPLGERWSCAPFFTGPNNIGYTCLGFVWENGVMRALPTLGGNNGFATGANNRGQVVGWAENTVRDPTCVAPQVLQFRAVIWGPGRDQIEELPLIPGDTSSAATAINNRGQVVGISGICDQAVGRHTARHAVIWEKGRVTDIGNIGGSSWNTPMAINQHGDVVGFAIIPGGDPNDPIFHAFLWTKHDGIRDLGTLPGDVSSQALGINERGQVVGLSSGAGGVHAFLWENGVMKDLNTLIAPGYAGRLEIAGDINDIGEITGRAFDPSTGERPAFLAIPR